MGTEIKGREIYERIMHTLDLRGIKVCDFCRLIGIRRRNLAMWKAGRLPPIDIMYDVKEELNVSLEWLVTGESNIDNSGEEYRAGFRDGKNHMKRKMIAFLNQGRGI